MENVDCIRKADTNSHWQSQGTSSCQTDLTQIVTACRTPPDPAAPLRSTSEEFIERHLLHDMALAI
jgi:hypothetical protein